MAEAIPETASLADKGQGGRRDKPAVRTIHSRDNMDLKAGGVLSSFQETACAGSWYRQRIETAQKFIDIVALRR